MLNCVVDRLRLPSDVSKTRNLGVCDMALSFPSESSCRGIKQPSTAFMLGSIFLLYVATGTHFAAKTAYVVAYGQLLNVAVVELQLQSSSSSSTETALIQFERCARTISYIIGAVIAVNVCYQYPLFSAATPINIHRF